MQARRLLLSAPNRRRRDAQPGCSAAHRSRRLRQSQHQTAGAGLQTMVGGGGVARNARQAGREAAGQASTTSRLLCMVRHTHWQRGQGRRGRCKAGRGGAERRASAAARWPQYPGPAEGGSRGRARSAARGCKPDRPTGLSTMQPRRAPRRSERFIGVPGSREPVLARGDKRLRDGGNGAGGGERARLCRGGAQARRGAAGSWRARGGASAASHQMHPWARVLPGSC